MRAFLADTGYALRVLLKKPGFAITAVLTLGLGIGATAAIFSVVNAVLLRPLPYDQPDRLVHLASDLRARNVEDFPWPAADFHDLRTTQTVFSDVAALMTERQVFVTPGQFDVEQVNMGMTTPNLFRLMSGRIVMGTDFSEADGVPQTPPAGPLPSQPVISAAPPRAILSHAFWQRRFGGDATIVGTVVRLGEQPFEIAGVLEPGFELLYPPGINVIAAPDMWIPLRTDFAAGSRINVTYRVVARLKDDVDLAAAQREMDAFASDLRRRFPIKETAGLRFRVEPMHEDLVRDVRPAIMALMAAVVFVLLIACANVANLLLVRAASRERELAVRAALGGTRGRIVRQLLAESLVLATLATAVGVGIAAFGIPVLLAIGPDNLPRLSEVRVDPLVLAFAAATGVVSVACFGLLPAVRASRPDIMDLLRCAGRAGSLSPGRKLRTAVVVAEVALSFVLLVGCGLMVRSFIALQQAAPGFDPHGVLTFETPALRLDDPVARQAFQRDLRDRLKALPGVVDATAARPLPLEVRNIMTRWGTEEALADPGRFAQARLHAILPGYFAAMKTRIVEGRDFTDADNRPDGRLVIIDRVLAAKAFPGQSAVGRRIVTRVGGGEPDRYEVIGVVEQQRHQTLAREDREAIYVPDGYFGHGVASRWAVRTTGDPMALAAAARRLVTEINPRTGAVDVQPMSAYVRNAQAQTRFALLLIGIFAAVALGLACVGLYSVLSTSVRQRTAEIGVRMTFGAGHARIFRMMVAEGIRLSALGIVIGGIAALLVTRAMESMLVGVEATDPWTFAAVAIGFILIAVVACGVPARRAARLDPLTALRHE